MRINDDLSQPVIVQAGKMDWRPSPAPGVDRRMLFRIGGEVARATSIVRYAPGSVFPRHTHGGGEEILVLDGVFQDEHGDYPAGSYLRNPPGTLIFQLRGRAAPSSCGFGSSERAIGRRWFGSRAKVEASSNGREFLVVSGSFAIGDDKLEAQSWGRLPAGTLLNATISPQGANVCVRDAPLLHLDIVQLSEQTLKGEPGL
ncbi:cupin domain-containing protein [Nitrosospira multiformis]|uniref:Anti-ECFsigma factor, ChrR n=1 Tax=Nitrosospira multiformis TaxID=1231 RepID=A0A1I7GVZ5_9PROT|nr:cupin domain-containing protein [Nitrosospira multiformis]SFU52592.1 anti-ECFsigma factor, ChrR [Nitrosospira multiformis]